ncbi:MAG TPA: glycosyltransferase family 2 protein [Gammaproteobacteria bacterium]|nr:glycosyltransferase family 2 protein [Gammaproteobacteria bacterium]
MKEVTIITPTFNSGDHLADCLRSISAQDVDVNHIIIDGASSDTTLEIIEEHGDKLEKIVSEPDSGIYHALNKGLALADSEIIGILNADDYYPANDVIARVLEVFRDPSIAACYGDLVYVDNRDINKIIRYWRAGEFLPEKFYLGWMPPHPTFFVRKSVFDRLGGFNTELGTAADYELMLRFLLKHRIKTAYIPEVLVHMRTGGASNASIANRLLAHRMDYRAWRVNDLRPRVWTIPLKPIRKIRQWIDK